MVNAHLHRITPDNKVHGANMGPTRVLSAPDGPHIGPMNLAIRELVETKHNSGSNLSFQCIIFLGGFKCIIWIHWWMLHYSRKRTASCCTIHGMSVTKWINHSIKLCATVIGHLIVSHITQQLETFKLVIFWDKVTSNDNGDLRRHYKETLPPSLWWG